MVIPDCETTCFARMTHLSVNNGGIVIAEFLMVVMPTYKALSVRQPDAWFLVQGIKTCENRTWNITHRGTLIIHAGSKAMTKDDWVYLRDICEQLELPVPNPGDPHLQTGGLISTVYLAEVTDKPDPDWEGGWWDEPSAGYYSTN